MRAGFRSTTESSRPKQVASYVVGLAVAAAVVYTLGVPGGALPIVWEG